MGFVLRTCPKDHLRSATRDAGERGGRRRAGADSGARRPVACPKRHHARLGGRTRIAVVPVNAPSRLDDSSCLRIGEGIIDTTIDSRCDVEVTRDGPPSPQARAGGLHAIAGAMGRTGVRHPVARGGARTARMAPARAVRRVDTALRTLRRKSSFVRASPAQRGGSISHSPIRWTDWTPHSGAWRPTRTGPIRNRRCATPRRRPRRPADAHGIAPPRG